MSVWCLSTDYNVAVFCEKKFCHSVRRISFSLRIRSFPFPLVNMEADYELDEIENTQVLSKGDQELGEQGLEIDGNQGQVSG